MHESSYASDLELLLAALLAHAYSFNILQILEMKFYFNHFAYCILFPYQAYNLIERVIFTYFQSL